MSTEMVKNNFSPRMEYKEREKPIEIDGKLERYARDEKKVSIRKQSHEYSRIRIESKTIFKKNHFVNLYVCASGSVDEMI